MSDAQTPLMDATEVRDTATAKKYFDVALKHEAEGNRLAAIDAYEAAYAADPDDSNICFRLAYCLDIVGEEDEAMHLYEQCAQKQQTPLNALINLAILYEDRGKYAQAERCVRQVLATDPNHPRARLFLKDILASKAMVIDDEQEKRNEKQTALLETPVTDFEMSVRTRNALRKMSIRTLGDLLKISEAELRSFKNFGDASLEEIKAMLAQKGLRLGQTVDAGQTGSGGLYDQLGGTPEQMEIYQKSVNELDLSVRARKALALLNVANIGDLCLKTEPELMGIKNFGTTSLVEIREKLQAMGVDLRTLDA